MKWRIEDASRTFCRWRTAVGSCRNQPFICVFHRNCAGIMSVAAPFIEMSGTHLSPIGGSQSDCSDPAGGRIRSTQVTGLSAVLGSRREMQDWGGGNRMRGRIDITMSSAQNLRQHWMCWEETGRTVSSLIVIAWRGLTVVCGTSSGSGTHSLRL